MSLVPPTLPVGVAGTAPAATVGTLVNAPESLKAADPGTIVKGTVEGRDRQGNLIVRTDHGAVALRTAANFRPGTALIMEVRAVGDSQQVVVLSVDRRAAPAQQPAQQPLPPQPAQTAQQTAQQAAQPGAQPSPPPTQGAGQAPGGIPAQPTGTHQAGAAASALQQTAPQAAPQAAPQTAPQAALHQQPAVSVASSPVIAASTQPPQPLQVGQTVQALLVQTLTGHPPGQAKPGAPASAPAQTASPQGVQAAAGAPPAATAPAAAAPPPVPPAPSSTTAPASAAIPATGVPTTGTPTTRPASVPVPATTPASTPLPVQPGGTAPSSPAPTTAPAAPAATPSAPTPPAGTPAAAGVAAPPAGQTAQTPVLPPSLTAPATSVSLAALPAGAPVAQILQALPVGSAIAVTVNAIQQPAQAQGTTGKQTSQAVAAGQVIQTGQATAAQAAQPPGVQPQPTGGATLTATVVGSTAAGQPLLQTSFGLVTIPGAQGLPVGTGVTLGLSPSALGNAEATARAALGLPPGSATGTTAGGQPASLGRAWPALNEAFAQLSQTNPPLAQTLLQTAIPQPGPQLAGALLFFMAALRGGDVRGWLGDQAFRALGGRDGRSPLLSRLSDDMARMTHSGTDAAGNEWRGFYIPLFDGRDLQQIRLFMRDPTEEGEGGAEGGSGHRFLIDLDLSKLGALQLDGLARKKRLDLIVRTHRALPREIKAEIVRLFEETAERVGLKGQVSFQATPHFPPLPFVENKEIIEAHSEIEA